MAKKDRTGNRKTREQRKRFKVPELGYYLIVTDTEATERGFFAGLYKELPEAVKNKFVIKVIHGIAARILDEYMKRKRHRSIQKQMSKCTKNCVKMGMKKKQFR